MAETHNVIYSGRIQPAGVSIFMEGTHRLILPDGRFILLQSETVDLNGYVGEEAEVTGAVRPTVEQGGTIMRVEQIRLLEFSSTSAEASSSMTEASASSAVMSAEPSSSVSISASSAPSFSSAISVLSSLNSSAASVASTVPVDLTARIALMAKQDLADGNWTQAYCTSHIGFCIPIHRNWWFKSFGAASPSLWHLEVSSEEIDTVGSGPLAVDLLSGSVGSKGAADGEIRSSGDDVIGYKEWTDNRHFEIRASSALQSAVEYMVQHLTPMEE